MAQRLECSPMARETWVQSQVKSYQRLKKWYLMPPCLTLSIIRYGSRVKWSNPGKGVAPSPTPWCSKLSKREPSGHPRLSSPTTTILYYIILFQRHRSTTSQILTIRRILEGACAKNLQATILFVDFTKAFDSIHRGKMEQILLAYGLPKETVTATMILYRNTKVKVCSPDGDTDYFSIVAGVLQGDTLAPYLFIICLDYVLRGSVDKIKENSFKLTKERSRRYPTKTITDTDYKFASGKYTHPSQNPATYSGMSHCKYWPPCQCTQNGIYVL